MKATITPATDALSLADLEAFDPYAPARSGRRERRFLCPLPACAGKRPGASHRSLSVNTETGAYHCHRCGADGKLREWWQERPVISRRDQARKRLRAITALPPAVPNKEPARFFSFFRPPCAHEEPRKTPQNPGPSDTWRALLHDLRPLDGTPAAAYLESRGIPPALAQQAGARYSADFFEQSAVVFPVRNAQGKLVAAQGRRLDPNAKPKALTCGPVTFGVFATPGAWDAATILLCEAPIDALSLAAAGFPALALCGTAVRPWLAKALAWKHVLLAFDADEAGDKAAAEWMRALRFGSHVQRLRPEGAKDWNELLQTHGRKGLCALLAPLVAATALTLTESGAEQAPTSRSLVREGERETDSSQKFTEKGAERPAESASITAQGIGSLADEEKPAGSPSDAIHAASCELLAPYAALIDGAMRALLPPGPMKLRPWLTITDPARCVLSSVDEIRSIADSDRCAHPTWRGVLADRLETLRLLAAWVDAQTARL